MRLKENSFSRKNKFYENYSFQKNSLQLQSGNFRTMKHKELPLRYCLYCGAPLSGRSDKKFCQAKCKSSYHNKQVFSKHYGIEIVKSMERNYSILKDLLKIGISSIPIKTLQELGFKASSCSEVIYKPYSVSYRCYNIEYKLSAKRIYGIKLTSSERVQP